MASGSNSTTVYRPNSSYGATLSVSFTENSTSTTNNTSNVTCSASLSYLNCKWDVTNSGLLRVYWHDNRENYDRLVAETYFNELGYNTSTRSCSGTIDVTHNDDGSLSGYAYAAWSCLRQYNNYVPNSGGVDTGWKTMTTIARASQPSVNTYPNNTPDFTVGDNVVIHTNRKSSSFTHTVVVTFGDWSKTLSTSATDNVSWDTSADKASIYATNTTGFSKAGTVSVTTKNGSTTIGTKTCDINALFNQSELSPTFTNFGYKDSNSTITAITGNNQVLVSGKSTLTATISTSQKATAKYSATMQSYTMTINGVSQSQAYSTSAITKNLGTVTLSTQETTNTVKSLVITAIDSRSKSTSVTKDITVIPYRAPIVNATATRENGFDNNTTIKISGTFSPILVNNTAKNNVSTSTGVKYRYKKASETTWTHDWEDKTATVNRTNGTVSVADFVISLDNQEAWNFEIVIADLLETTTAALTVSVGQPAFFIGEDGRVGVGGMPNKSKLTGEQGLVQVFGRLFADNIYPVGSIYMSATLDTVAKVQNALGGTWVKWGAGRVPVGVDTAQTEFDSIEKTGGNKSMQKHSHTRGTMNITGQIDNLTWDNSVGFYGISASGAMYKRSTYPSGRLLAENSYWGSGSDSAGLLGFDASRNWSGHTSEEGAGDSGNLQPYITCYMYKRTA